MSNFYFIERDGDGKFLMQHRVEWDGEGPPAPPEVMAGSTVDGLARPLDLHAPTPTSMLDDATLQWVETISLAQLSAGAIQQIDAAAESLRMAVVNHMTMQTEEYRRVEVQARAWREAGYPEEEGGISAPRGVRGWAMAKWRDGWTNRQAADDILATADGWMHILDEVRDLRLANKEDVRHAADAGEVAAICADMRSDMQTMATQLNLTLTE